VSLKKYIRGCVSLKRQKSQGKAVEVTVNSKEENSQDFCLDLVQEFSLFTPPHDISEIGKREGDAKKNSTPLKLSIKALNPTHSQNFYISISPLSVSVASTP
jgi:hypothetical protein